mmetsp:Transcript_14116/g.34410  ORF Transcript_14116/g.34410 Transcript_14116/m.34410 type:complete len:86 (+) Transcript_14116:886-1143(+)
MMYKDTSSLTLNVTAIPNCSDYFRVRGAWSGVKKLEEKKLVIRIKRTSFNGQRWTSQKHQFCITAAGKEFVRHMLARFNRGIPST